MQRIEVERWPKNRVAALFESGAASFDTAPKAALTDLVGPHANPGMNQDGALTGVTVRLDPGMDELRNFGRGRDQKRDRR